MEIVLVKIEHQEKMLTYSGAGRSLYYFSDKGLNRYVAPRYSVGGLIEGFQKSFICNTVKYQTGDRIYMFSDGFEDQFGGIYGKKYSRKRKEDLLEQVQSFPFSDHGALLEQDFIKWKGERSQIDDVMVVGIEL